MTTTIKITIITLIPHKVIKKIRLAAMDFLWPGPLLDKMRLTTINIIIISIIIYIIVSIIISIIISIFE